MIRLLFIALFSVFATNLYAESRQFSSYLKGSKDFAVVKDDNVFFVKFNKEGASYFLPNDGCYDLVNDFSFCVKLGKIYDVLKSDYAALRDDLFFNQSSQWCNDFKYKTTRKIFLEKSMRAGRTYQLIFLKQPTIQSINILQDTIKEGEMLSKIEYSYVLDKFNVVSCPPEGFYFTIKKDDLEKLNELDNSKGSYINTSVLTDEEESDLEKEEREKKERKKSDDKFIKAIKSAQFREYVVFYKEKPEEYDFQVKDHNLVVQNIKVKQKAQKQNEDTLVDILKREELEILNLYDKK